MHSHGSRCWTREPFNGFGRVNYLPHTNRAKRLIVTGPSETIRISTTISSPIFLHSSARYSINFLSDGPHTQNSTHSKARRRCVQARGEATGGAPYSEQQLQPFYQAPLISTLESVMRAT